MANVVSLGGIFGLEELAVTKGLGPDEPPPPPPVPPPVFPIPIQGGGKSNGMAGGILGFTVPTCLYETPARWFVCRTPQQTFKDWLDRRARAEAEERDDEREEPAEAVPLFVEVPFTPAPRAPEAPEVVVCEVPTPPEAPPSPPPAPPKAPAATLSAAPAPPTVPPTAPTGPWWRPALVALGGAALVGGGIYAVARLAHPEPGGGHFANNPIDPIGAGPERRRLPSTPQRGAEGPITRATMRALRAPLARAPARAPRPPRLSATSTRRARAPEAAPGGDHFANEVYEVRRRFAGEDDARAYLEAVRWPHGPVCPHCASSDARPIEENVEARVRGGLYRCGGCSKQFTVTVGTIFEGSHVTLSQWLVALYLLGVHGEEVSTKALQAELGLGSYRSARLVRLRLEDALDGHRARTLDGLVRRVL